MDSNKKRAAGASQPCHLIVPLKVCGHEQLLHAQLAIRHGFTSGSWQTCRVQVGTYCSSGANTGAASLHLSRSSFGYQAL